MAHLKINDDYIPVYAVMHYVDDEIDSGSGVLIDVDRSLKFAQETVDAYVRMVNTENVLVKVKDNNTFIFTTDNSGVRHIELVSIVTYYV